MLVMTHYANIDFLKKSLFLRWVLRVVGSDKKMRLSQSVGFDQFHLDLSWKKVSTEWSLAYQSHSLDHFFSLAFLFI